MITALFSWIGGKITALQDAVGGWLFDLWEGTRKAVMSYWGVIVIMAGLAYSGLTLVGDLTIQGFVQLARLAGNGWHAGIDSPNAPGGLTNILSIANTFYPLDETLRYLAALITFVWLPIGLYRLVKSWIPGGFAGGS